MRHHPRPAPRSNTTTPATTSTPPPTGETWVASPLDCLSTIPLDSGMPPPSRGTIRSMTGFGAGSATVGAERISVEFRSVNHKFCEV